MGTTTIRALLGTGVTRPVTATLGEFFGKNFAGFATGFRAYRIYNDLSARSDGELAALGLKRSDLPRIAMDEAVAQER